MFRMIPIIIILLIALAVAIYTRLRIAKLNRRDKKYTVEIQRNESYRGLN